MSIFSNNLFKLKDTPIVLGVLLLFITWSANYVVTRVAVTPLIEYQINWMDSTEYKKFSKKHTLNLIDCITGDQTKDEFSHYIEVTLTNLSDKSLLQKVSLAFKFPKKFGAEVRASQLVSVAPAIRGDNNFSCGKNFMRIDNLNFHPRWKYQLIIAITGESEIQAVLMKSSKPIIFEEANIKTWMVKNEMLIVIISLIFSIFLTIWYLYELSINNGDDHG